MFEIIKKWFGKKEEKEVEKFTYEAIISFKDGEKLKVISYYWESPNEVSRRFAEALEYHKWFFVGLITGERVVIQSEDVERVTVLPEPVKKD